MAKPRKKTVRNTPDAKEIYRHAYSFLFAYHQIMKSSDPSVRHMQLYPSCVVSAFANELLFKCIHAIDKTDPERTKTHRLDTLFKRLSNARQSEIKDLWNKSNQKKMIENLKKQTGQDVSTEIKKL